MKKRRFRPKLKDIVKAAKAAGCEVHVGLQPRKMPRRFPNDHEHVKFLIAESERITELGHRWTNAEKPNPIAAQKCFELGWAHALSAAWLRCKLKGEYDKPGQ